MEVTAPDPIAASRWQSGVGGTPPKTPSRTDLKSHPEQISAQEPTLAGEPPAAPPGAPAGADPARPVPGGSWIRCEDPGGQFGHPINLVDLDDSRARHSCWHWRRQQIWNALRLTCTDAHRLARFANCGACAWLQTDGEDLRIVAQHCGDRFCLPCQLARGHRLHRALQARMQLERTRFATLTLKHRDTPLKQQLRDLYLAFTRLRRSKTWRKYVTGGAAFLEVKLSQASGEWHPHLHLLLAGHFFPVEELRAAWLLATGDSCIVDIRAIGTDDAAAKYVTKYVTKPAHFEVIARPAKLVELICALHGKRSFSTFGEWHSWPLDVDAPDQRQWRFVAPLSHLDRPENTRWREAAARKWPELAQVYRWNTSPTQKDTYPPWRMPPPSAPR